MKLYNAPALPILSHGSEIWNLRENDKKKRLTSVEIKFFRRTVWYSLFDDKRNQILVELKVEPAEEKLIRYKSSWLRHVTEMNKKSAPKIMLDCRPNG
jgi:hypothetical protein